jgi:hypothetical protein
MMKNEIYKILKRLLKSYIAVFVTISLLKIVDKNFNINFVYDGIIGFGILIFLTIIYVFVKNYLRNKK